MVTESDLARANRCAPLPFAKLCLIMVTLIFLGCVNFLLLKELYTAYGDKNAFFVNQGVNLLYIIYGGVILYPRMCFTNVVTPEMKALSKHRFVVMGFLDALGTFFTAMGAAFTPGSMQPLLNQTLIPWIIIFSRLYLRKAYTRGELCGAGLIMIGACASALPPMFVNDSEDALRWYAVVLYAISNVPMAMSSCYKEGNFQEQELDVWYLTQWVSIFQFLISFVFMPLLCLPGFGSKDGMAMSEIPAQISSGWDCCMQVSPDCRDKPTFWLLIGYCAVNVMYNTLGLYLVKVASALMNALSYAILLPCTTLMFFTPMAGVAQEHFHKYNICTMVGLLLALWGFMMYQQNGQLTDEERRSELFLSRTTTPILTPPGHRFQESFQERVIGISFPHAPNLDVNEARRAQGGSADQPLNRPLLNAMGGGSLPQPH
mmetsp:Transcript_64185/g.139454  ORF Transcript_64185/g.139454 Transcript_64185/m.139454 type:complete len:431 (-) Transcript_64185:462-1754(-)